MAVAVRVVLVVIYLVETVVAEQVALAWQQEQQMV